LAEEIAIEAGVAEAEQAGAGAVGKGRAGVRSTFVLIR
jgi:hypothetical protein